MTHQFKRLSHSIYECKYHSVSTIGLDEEKIRTYVKWQEAQEKQAELSQQHLFD